MKKQNVTFLFPIEVTIPIVIGTCSTLKQFNVHDVVVFQPGKKRPLYFQIQEISEDTDGSLEIVVEYFGGRKVMKRASIFNASIIPIEEVKLNYQHIVACMLCFE
jgi:ribosomal protein L20A (L18A)